MLGIQMQPLGRRLHTDYGTVTSDSDDEIFSTDDIRDPTDQKVSRCLQESRGWFGIACSCVALPATIFTIVTYFTYDGSSRGLRLLTGTGVALVTGIAAWVSEEGCKKKYDYINDRAADDFSGNPSV